MNLPYKRVVVTGGAGFIGSHLTDYLLSQDVFVHVIDDFSNGRRKNLPLEDKNLFIEQLDITSCVDESKAMLRLEQAIANTDFVFHLASPIGVQYVHSYRLGTLQSILKSGLCIVNICSQYQRPLLFTSSSEVYGYGDSTPLKENSALNLGIQARWSYGVAKLAVEHLVVGLYQEKVVPAWVVRFFNVTGARQRPERGLVVPFFCKAALDGKPLIIHGDGLQRRCFLHVADAVHGIILVTQSEYLRGQSVNLGGTEEITIKQIAEKIFTLLNYDGKITFSSYKDAFGENFAPVLERKPDISLMQEFTNWQPKFTVDHAIEECLQSLREK